MLRPRGIILIIICGIGSLTECSYSQSNPTTIPETNLLDQFFLVRRPDFISNCVPITKADGIIVFRSKTPDSTSTFQVLTRSGGVVATTVTATMVLDTCIDFDQQEISFGLLRAKSSLGWPREIDALIGLRLPPINPLRIGSVSLLSDSVLRSKCLAAIRPAIPDSEHFDLKTQFQFTAPGGKKKFLLVSVDRYVEKNRTLAGDQAIYPTGFVFTLENGNPRLLFAENYLSRVFSISDLDNDGIYEIAVYSGGWGDASYVVRLFDGTNFLKDGIVLYHWGD